MPGESLLEFTVLGELAMGGMGRVDLARCDGDGRLLAIKRIHRHLLSDESIVRMFLDEARLMAALHHPNIVALEAFGSDDDGMFLATELVRGASLSALHKAAMAIGRRVPDDVIAIVGTRVARGLAAVHGLASPSGAPLGLVHRDISPDNVLLGVDGQIKVSDFGIAKARFLSSRTTTGNLKGKLHFMSPEYVQGRPIDGTSDLFSLGVVLYRLITNASPFRGEHEREVLRNVVEQDPEPPSRLVPDVDRDLARSVERLLSKRATDRGDAASLAIELDAWLARRGTTDAGASATIASFVEELGASQLEKIDRLARGAPDAVTVRPSVSRITARTLLDAEPPRPEGPDSARPRTSRGRAAHEQRDEDTSESPGTRKVKPLGAPPGAWSSPPRARGGRTWGWALGGLALAVAAGVAAVRMWPTRAETDATHATAAATASIGSSATSGSGEPAPSAPRPEPSLRSTIEPPTPGSAPAPLSRSAAPPRASARPGPRATQAASARAPSSAAAAPCTPDNWDYPRCLRR